MSSEATPVRRGVAALRVDGGWQRVRGEEGGRSVAYEGPGEEGEGMSMRQTQSMVKRIKGIGGK